MDTVEGIEKQLQELKELSDDWYKKENSIYIECNIRLECLEPLLEALRMTERLDNS